MIASPEGVTYREMITGDRFFYGAEVVTTRGISGPDSPHDLLAHAKAFLDDPRFGWISITDNPGGAPMLPPDWLFNLIREHCNRVVVHLTCKDMNRNALEAAAWRYASEGCDNILAITGDYPTEGFGGTASGVFDFDSVALIALLAAMNEGLKIHGRRGKIETLPPTAFFIGCVVSPFKRYERELMPQYFKLIRKIDCGAQWVIPQLGYDMRKFHEVKLLLEARDRKVPVLGNVYLLTRGVARMFHAGKLAGCVVSDELMDTINRYASGEDKGRRFLEELAAKQLAVFKGLGFTAGYLGGMAKPETFGKIVELAESYGENDWRDFIKEIQYSQPDEFFLFEHDPTTGLSAPDRVNPAYLASLEHPPKTKNVTFGYRMSRRVHNLLFDRDRGLYGAMRRLYGRWDRKSSVLARLTHGMERQSKFLLYGCKDCGDCSLPDCAYLCPQSACSKCGRNGPCGGSRNGRCELDDKDCIWARAYERLKYYGESETMLDRPITLYNATLKDTSAWANLYLERDHHARDEGLEARG